MTDAGPCSVFRPSWTLIPCRSHIDRRCATSEANSLRSNFDILSHERDGFVPLPRPVAAPRDDQPIVERMHAFQTQLADRSRIELRRTGLEPRRCTGSRTCDRGNTVDYLAFLPYLYRFLEPDGQ